MVPMSRIASIAREIAERGAVVRVTVIRADGSTPRETGAAMLVGARHFTDTIGGGALELEAIAHARRMLSELGVPPPPSLRASPNLPPAASASGEAASAPAWQRDVREFALGPSLGQCCGGYARLLFEMFTAREHAFLAALAGDADPDTALVVRRLEAGRPLEVATRPDEQSDRPLPVTRALRDMLSGARPREAMLVRGAKGETAWFVEPMARRLVPLYIYGAGHVGRALVHMLRDLPFAVTWADTSILRFPDAASLDVQVKATPDLPALAYGAAAGAYHIVMTYSHAIDLAICHAVLRRGDFGHLGLIGSATKRTRFLKRLTELGIASPLLARLTCPIGLPGLGGKEPGTIAVAVAAQLVQLATVGRQETAGGALVAKDGRR
jgi:xanthine dehydrogenase accessory factor